MKKIWKLTFKSLAIVAPVTGAAATIVSCGHKSDTKNSWGDFKDKAMAETAINIVTHARVKATGWDISKTDDFSFTVKPAVDKDGSTVVATIASATNSNIAIFTATYSTDEEYIDSDWACTTQPNNVPSFDNFKKAAENAAALDIVKQLKVTGWKTDGSEKFSKGAPQEGTKDVTYIIYDNSIKSKITAKATFNGNKYNIGDWTMTSGPSPAELTFDAFLSQVKSDDKQNQKHNIWILLKSARANSKPIPNINVDFSFSDTMLEVKPSSTITGDAASDTVSMNIVLGPKDLQTKGDYLFTYNITLTLRWDHKNNYSADYGYANWTLNYDFNAWKKTTSDLFKTSGFKTWASHNVISDGTNWNLSDCTFSALSFPDNKSATFTITNKTDTSTVATYNAAFTSSSKKGLTLNHLFGDEGIDSQWVESQKTDAWAKYQSDADYYIQKPGNIRQTLHTINGKYPDLLPSGWLNLINNNKPFSAKKYTPTTNPINHTVYYKITSVDDPNNAEFDIMATQEGTKAFNQDSDFKPVNSGVQDFDVWFNSAKTVLTSYNDANSKVIIGQLLHFTTDKFPNYNKMATAYKGKTDQLYVKIDTQSFAKATKPQNQINFKITVWDSKAKKAVTAPAFASFSWTKNIGKTFDINKQKEHFYMNADTSKFTPV